MLGKCDRNFEKRKIWPIQVFLIARIKKEFKKCFRSHNQANFRSSSFYNTIFFDCLLSPIVYLTVALLPEIQKIARLKAKEILAVDTRVVNLIFYSFFCGGRERFVFFVYFYLSTHLSAWVPDWLEAGKISECQFVCLDLGVIIFIQPSIFEFYFTIFSIQRESSENPNSQYKYKEFKKS